MSSERYCPDCGVTLELPSHPHKKYCQTCHDRRMATAVTISRQNRRAADLGIPGRITCDEWIDLCQRHDNTCLRCGCAEPLTIDHVIPFGYEGSTNTIENVQPLCKSCNSIKSGRIADYRYEEASVRQLRRRVLAELGEIHPCRRERYAFAWISPSGDVFRVEARKHYFWLHMKGRPVEQIFYMHTLVTQVGASNITVEQRQALLTLWQRLRQDHGYKDRYCESALEIGEQ